MFEAGRESALAVEEASFSLATAERDLLVDQQSLRDVEDVLLDATQARFAWRLVPVGDVRAAAQAPLPEGDGLQKRLVTAVARRPDLRQLAIDLQRARVDLAAARNRALPSLGVYGTAGRASPGDDGSALGAGVGAVVAGAPYLEGGVSLSMPLGPAADPLGLDAARLVVTTRELQLTDKVEGVQREVRAAWRDVELSTQRFVVASQAAALADRKLSLTIDEFRERKTDSFKVLRYQDDLLAARLSEIEAATDVIQARAELDRVTGVGADPFRGVVDQVEVR
jgi:outer membrane protein TolC